MSRASRDTLVAQIRSFGYWHYPFDLGDGIVIVPTHGWADAALELRDFIWPTIRTCCGGDLRGLRVLDIACNAGFWSLEAYRSGAAYVLGVDASSEALEQAQLVRTALDISDDRVAYRQLNVYDLSPETVGEYDLCLLFRVLHHLENPLLALQRVRSVCRGVLVVDVSLNAHPDAVLTLRQYDAAEPFGGVGSGLAMKPSRAALELMLQSSGFVDVTFVEPTAPFTQNDYVLRRRAFFTARVDSST